jgi:hypothetical protein
MKTITIDLPEAFEPSSDNYKEECLKVIAKVEGLFMEPIIREHLTLLECRINTSNWVNDVGEFSASSVGVRFESFVEGQPRNPLKIDTSKLKKLIVEAISSL